MTAAIETILADFPIPEGSRVLVCGGRDYPDRDLVWSILARVKPAFIVTGGQGRKRPNRGADLHAEAYAKTNKVPFDVVHADWDAFGRSAGPRRNSEMLIKHPETEWTIAFPGDTGTADMIKKTKRAKIRLLQIKADGRHEVTVDYPEDEART